MPTRIDSKVAMRAIISDPATFPTVVAAVDKDMPKYITAHFKDKSMDLARLKATCAAFGEQGLTLSLESLDEKVVAALLKKVDPHAGMIEPNASVKHLGDLALGRVNPHPKPEKPIKATTTVKAPPKRAGADKAASAKGTGTRPTGSTAVEEATGPSAEAAAKPKRSKVAKQS